MGNFKSLLNFCIVDGRLDAYPATARLLCDPGVGERGRGGKRDDIVGVKDVGGKEDGWGFTLTFTLAPQLMLRCCHFHHLKCCHFRCWSLVFTVVSGGGFGGGRARGRKSGKISILNKHNFVMPSPDYHGSASAMFPNFLSPFCFFSCFLLFSCLPSSFSRTL